MYNSGMDFGERRPCFAMSTGDDTDFYYIDSALLRATAYQA
jgi:hypothetical protein